ncbi:MAG TPA: hypothetical protein VJH92_01500 [Candidatus Nanoarchaeia archaeon]|nr:hypothetical protein [Candidatus Nanoarchaeia archaeon]
MRITAQIKFSSQKQKVEGFGDRRYLVYILSGKDDEGAMSEFVVMMSREIGVSTGRIHYVGKQGNSYIFEVE